jgi:hypothetical protein
MFTAGVRVWRIRSSWSSSSAGIRDSKSSGNSLSVNSSTRGIEADLRQRESSFSFSYTKTGSNTVGTVMNATTMSSSRRTGCRTIEFIYRLNPLLRRSKKSVSAER